MAVLVTIKARLRDDPDAIQKIHDHGLAPVAEQVGGVGEAADVELMEVHGGLPMARWTAP